jgi:hypothetical protein
MSQRLYHSVLFIDARVADAQVLAASAAEGVLVVQLSADSDGVQQIAAALQGLEGLDSIQIISHGASGQLQIGDSVLDAAGLATQAAALQQWGSALRDGGDLLLYGCDVAQGDTGLAFIDALAAATGADVAASTDVTGSELLGANWVLEANTGSIEAASAVSDQAQQEYAHTLLANNGTIAFGTTADVTLLNATGLAAGAVVNVNNILGTGLDLYTQSTNGGSVTVVNANGTSLLGIPLNDDRLTINGSLLSPVSYVDLRAGSGVFDLTSIKIGSGNLVGNLVGNVIFTVYALDANFQPIGGGQSVVGLVANENGLLNLGADANFKGIFGVRIVNPLGFEVAIDDVIIANARIAPSITSAAYNAGSGVLTVTAAGINAGDNIDPSKFTVSGQGGSYTLTSPVVAAASGTSFTFNLNAADKLALNGVLNNNGGTAVSGAGFNLAAALNWDTSRPSGQDLTGNPVTVSNVQLPTIASATYDATTHTLTVTGSNLVGTVGPNNDITVAKLALRGEGGASYTLSTTGNVEVTNANSFSVVLTGADIAAVAALLNRNGTVAAGGGAYTLAAGDDWNSAIGNANIGVAGVAVTVSNVQNSPPSITGVSLNNTGDNAAINPFANVTVADIDGDTVSLAINYTAANGVLSGAGLSGSAGSYTLSAASPAALTALLRALTFTPTNNQVVVGANVNTTFALVATDAVGNASAVNTGTVISATSINDAPIVAGTVAGQAVAAGGTLRPFSNVVISDPDVGSSVIITLTVSTSSTTQGFFTPASASAAGFVTTDGGLTYSHTSAAPGAAQAALQALVYQAAPGQSGATTLSITVSDGHVVVNNTGTTIVSTVPSSSTALSVAFSSDSGISNSDLVTNVAAQTISGTLSSALQSGDRVEISLDNGATWTTAAANAGATTFQLAGQTLTGAGVLQVRVSNAGGSSTPYSVNYALDTTAPTTTGSAVTFSSDSGASNTDLITRIAQQTVSGTLSASLAADEHVEVSFNNGTTWTTASSSAGSSAWSLTGVTLAGSNTIQVRVVDAAGNTGTAQANAYVLDVAGPTATLSSSVSVAGAGLSTPITVSFSETPYGLSLASFSGVNGTVSNLQATADPRVYTVDYTPNGSLGGLIGGVQLAAGTYTDLAGNTGAAAAALGISITLGPTVVITSDRASLNASQVANLTFTFSSTPFGFTTSDIVTSGGSISNLVNQGNGIYTAQFTPGANVTGPASITVTGGSYTDGLGLQGGSGITPVIALDTVAPIVAISSNLGSLKLGDSATITFTFSEAPVGFVAGDVTVTNGVLSNLTATANPLVYTAQLIPNSGVASGAVSVTVAGGSYTDAAGNPGVAGASPAISIDTVAPVITATGVSFSADAGASNSDLITNVAAQTISGTLGAALGGDETVQVSLDNGATWVNASAAAGGTGWSLAGVTLAGSGTLQVRVTDAAGNHGPAFSTAYVLDTTAPTVTVASDAAALGVGQSANLTFTFSEAPANFSLASLTIAGGTVSGLTVTANPLVYTGVFTPTPGQSGAAASVAVNAGGYIDAAGNGGQASAPAAITVNTAVPSLVITSNDSALTVGESAQITFTFSTAPVGFTALDVAVANGALSGLVATANPLVYTALFTPTAGLASASAAVSVAPGSYTDAFGNSGSGATSLPLAIDTLAPTLAITSSSAALKMGETAQITFTFSELPVGFNAASIGVTGGALSGLAATANPLVYTALFNPTAGIENVSASFALAPGAVTDAAGNAVTAPASPPLAIDTLAPVAVANTVVFSADTGTPGDLLTNTAAQTISGTLGAPLGSGEFVEVSIDNGASWTTATSAGNGWTLAGQTLAGQNVLQVRVTDGAGNHGALYAQAYAIDTTAPTASIGSSTAALKAGEAATITISFSEVPVGFTLASLNASGGNLSGFAATANPLVYTVVFTPTAGVDGGSGVVGVIPGSYADNAGNAGLGITLSPISVDTQAPLTLASGVVFSADSGTGGDRITNIAAQDISGTLNANLANGETVEVSLDNGVTWQGASASAGAPGWTLAGQTLLAGPNHQVQVRVSDAAGNHGAASGFGYTLDQSAPTLQISSAQQNLNSADTPLITFTFSEAPQNFNAGSIVTTGGSLTGFTSTANPLVYTAVLTPVPGQASGVATVVVAAGAYQDAAGNNGLAASVTPITYATVAPGVSITSNLGALKAGDVALITFKFSSTPVGFTFGDIAYSGGVLNGFTATGSPLVYTAQFTPNVGTPSGAASISIANNAYTDGSANVGAGGSLQFAIDTVAPTLAITSDTLTLNAGSTALITFTFSEVPAAFALGDLGVTNGVLSNLVQTADPRVYTAVFTPTADLASGTGQVTLSYTDVVGNIGSTSGSPAIAIDTLAPVLTSGAVVFLADNGASATDLITNVALQDISGTLSGNLAAGEKVQVSLDNGAIWVDAVAAPGASGWVLAGQTLAPGAGSVQVRVTDNAGNHGAVTTSNYLLDTAAPGVTITSSAASLRAGESALISFTFSEAPAGFTLADLVPSGGTLSGFTATANPLVYTVVLTPLAGVTGGASVTLADGLYTDVAGNPGTGGSLPSISVDTIAPQLTIGTSSSVLKVGETATITLTFSEAPVGFTQGSVSASNGSLSNFTATANPLVYTATFTPTAGLAAGNAVISVAPGVISDAAGNLGAGASSAAIAIDTLAPTTSAASVAFSADTGASSTDLVTNVAAQTISGTLGAPLVGDERVEVSLDGGVSWLTALVTGPAQWSLSPQLLNDNGGAPGTIQVRVADAAGNTGPVQSVAYLLDQAPPTMAFSSNVTSLLAGEVATLTLTFSDIPTGFDVTDLVAVNGTLSNFTATADPRVYTVQLTPVAGLQGASTSVTLAPGLYTDVAGNAGGGASSPLITVENTTPVLQITSSNGLLAQNQQAVIQFSFSKTPVGFDAGDIVVTGGVLSGFGATANPLIYTAIFTPTAGVSNGTATVAVAGGFTDVAGNPGAPAAMAPISYSTLAPTTTGATVSLSNDTGISNTDLVTNNPLQTISGTLSANLAAGETVEVSLDGGQFWIAATAPAGNNGWALQLPVLLSGSGTLQVRVNDAAGNHGPVWATSYAFDTTPPTVVIDSDTAVLLAGQSANLTFTFNELPQGFTAASLTVTGGTITGLAVTADPYVYTAVFTPTTGFTGAAGVSLAPGSYTDTAGNAGVGGVLPAINVDALAPSLAITSSVAQLKVGDTALITFTFSEAPVGFGVDDISVSNGALSGFAATANPLVYTAVFTPSAGVAGANAAISVAPNGYTDLAGNGGSGATGPSITVDTQAPAAAPLGFPTFSADTGFSSSDLVTAVAAQTVSGALSQALTSGESVEVSFDNGATWESATVNGTSWSLAHTLTGSGVLRVRVVDAVGNFSAESTNNYALDQTAPTVVISSNVPVANGVEPALITFTFSEPPTGFSAANVAVTGGILGALTATADPRVYTATFTPPAGVAAGTASIAVNGGYTDGAGNSGVAGNIPTLQIDTVPPVAAVSGGVQFSDDSGAPGDLITNNPQQTLTGTLNAALDAGDVVQVSLDGGLTFTVATVNGLAWTLAGQTLAGSGNLVVRVADAAGNFSAVQTTPYTVDTVAPTVAITSTAPVLLPGQATTLTFTFSEVPQGVSAAALTVTGGTITGFAVTADPTVYTALFTPAPGFTGTVGVTLAAGSYLDAAGNAGVGGTLPGLVVDGQAPTLAITSSTATLKAGETALITFTFSEPTLGFGADDVAVANGTLSGFTATSNPLVYTAIFTPTADLASGTAAISVAPALYTDIAGNAGVGATGPAIAIDTLAPLSVALGSPVFSADTGISNTDLITAVAAQTVSGNLSLPLAADEAVQVSFDDGATWLVATVNGTAWSLDHLLSGSGVLRVRVVDGFGNHSAETVNPWSLNQAVPTVVITSNVPVANGVEPAIITFTFSAAPGGFTAANVAVTGGVLGPLTATADPLVYTATFTAPADVPAGTATIAVTGYADVAGNTGTPASIPSLQIDTVPPLAVADGAIRFSHDNGVAGDLITNDPRQTLAGTLNAALAAGDVVQVSVDGGLTWLLAGVNGLTWSLPGVILPTNVAGSLVVRVADAAGNVSAAQSVPYLVDTIAPTIVVSSSSNLLVPGQSATITFTLSEVGVLDLSGINVAGGTLTNFSGSGTTYTATLTPTGTTAVTIGVAGQLFTDVAGNGNVATAPLVLPVVAGQAATIDGVSIVTQTGVDVRTGLATRTVSVPVVTTVRNEDTGTPHPTLADIPLGIAANGDGVGSTLTVSVPVGVGFDASGPSTLVSGAVAQTDLIGRIDDNTVASATRTAMEAQARLFLATQDANELQQNGTLRVSGNSTIDNTWMLIAGDTSVQAGTLNMAQGLRASALAAGDAIDLNTELALVIDARALSGVGLQIDNVDFAAIVGAARVQGGLGQNFLIGDDAAQHITLTFGTDNDTLYGNGGNDILGTAGGNDHLDGGDGDDILFAGAGNDVLVAGTGNDVLQGGRTDSGQWRFALQADGTVLGTHASTLLGTTETVIVAELNKDIDQLGFAGASAAKLETLSLLYHAAFDRAPDLGGLSFWASQSLTAQQYASGFLAQVEARDGLMKLSNADFVSTLLRNTLDREPTSSELAGFVARLDAAPNDATLRASVLSDIAQSAAHKALWMTAGGMDLGGELLTQEQGWLSGSGNDRLVAGSGANLLVGGDGTDTAVFTGAVSSHKIVLSPHTSSGSNGADVMVGQSADAMNTVRGIELGEFDGQTIDLSLTQASTSTLQEIGMLYQLTLDRSGDYGGFQFWLSQNTTGAALAKGFTQSAEFKQLYGTLDDAAFVTQIFRNATDAAPDATTLTKWDAYLDTHSRDEMIAQLVVDATLVGIQTGTNGLTLIGNW